MERLLGLLDRPVGGGRVVFEGAPADLVAARPTLTNERLADYVGA
ncbi:hypothetical protein ACWEQL_01680 [Kitasatospora sp. NPDC004240]